MMYNILFVVFAVLVLALCGLLGGLAARCLILAVEGVLRHFRAKRYGRKYID